MRCIFHVDMDAFFASVEIAKDPSLKGKPVVIGGRPDQRGVVSTCSYEARAFGIHSAMSLSEAHRLCPHAIFITGDFSCYKECSQKVFSLFYTFTSFVEVVSIDEAYIDVTTLIEAGTPPQALANTIRKQVFEETGLTCSIGIATNKLVAKIGSGKAKPNGVCIVSPGNEAAFLAPLSIQSLPGVGAKTQEILNKEGLHTIADLQNLSMDELIRLHGAWGYHFFHAARGQDNREVHWENSPPKSIGAETTFEKDLSDLEILKEELLELLKKAYPRLRAHKMRAKRISIKLRYSNFKTITRSHTLETHVNDFESLKQAALASFQIHYGGYPPLRLLGISFEQLSNGYWQPTLF